MAMGEHTLFVNLSIFVFSQNAYHHLKLGLRRHETGFDGHSHDPSRFLS
jgi:hypothetical protein